MPFDDRLMLIFDSSKRFLTHKSLRQVSVRAKYSASVEESTTSRCSFDLQTTGALFSIMRNPAVDIDVDGSPAKSAAEYATTFVPSCYFR
ncbi:hypothetical protein K470DRAFT_259691 [Piedraia hortae CBS 480.64]|uniref:Uncharacterized protein n=1 Tax=Piedraia hortae CBS 480.64 TaxID=1314780 RepID=A0A6A7BTC9_9PEZI|nr:hypothetical protein K470DRAFT_259691 [Piedraia hortae CBS 480.64]